MECRPRALGLHKPQADEKQHGGDIAPEDIADRTTGCSEPDWESWPLAQAVWAAFAAARPDRPPPALVGLKLSRGKMDANRARCPCCEPPEWELDT